MDNIVVTKVSIEKNPINTGENTTIKVYANSITAEPVAYRLPFVLGKKTIKE